MKEVSKTRHPKSCRGSHLVDDDERTATCYGCGHVVRWSDVPMDVSRGRWRHPAGFPGERQP